MDPFNPSSARLRPARGAFDDSPFRPGVSSAARRWRLQGAILAAVLALVAGPAPGEQQILPDPVQSSMGFGTSLARFGDWAIVGAPRDHWTIEGSARILRNAGGVWEETARLFGDDVGYEGRFGAAVAIADFLGTRALVGAPNHADYTGAAYVFVLEGELWQQEARLVAGDSSTYDMFGAAVALFDDVALVGAPGHEGGGLVYVFERSGSTWSQTGTIAPEDPSSAAHFGSAVALAGLGVVAVIGAETHDHSGLPELPTGAAYVFLRSGTSWVQDAELLPSDPWYPMYFGRTVAAAGLGHRVVVGAPGSLSEPHAGSAYVFEHGADDLWHEVALLVSGAGEARNGFGGSVAMASDGDYVAVGDPYALAQRGAVFGFGREDGTWRRAGSWIPDLASGDARSGFSVALWTSQILTGAPFDDSALPDAGAVYVEGELVFADGFESGNASAWSASVP